MDKKVYVAPKVETFENEAEQGFSATSASLSVKAVHGWDDGDDYDEVSF